MNQDAPSFASGTISLSSKSICFDTVTEQHVCMLSKRLEKKLLYKPANLSVGMLDYRKHVTATKVSASGPKWVSCGETRK